MDDEIRKEIDRMIHEIDDFREYLRILTPIVKEYYARKNEEMLVGYL